MPEAAQLIRDSVWNSLTCPHSFAALRHGRALRYQADVLPFATLGSTQDGPPSPEALADLAELLTPGETIWLVEHRSAPIPRHPAIRTLRHLPGMQMLLAATQPLAEPDPGLPISELSAADLPEMLELIRRNFPGFFLSGTMQLGRYFGIRTPNGQLVSMLGERFAPPGHIELSALCTERAFRGQGHAAALLTHLSRLHRAEGLRSWLGVAAGNTNAVALYRHLGFEFCNEVIFAEVTRTA